MSVALFRYGHGTSRGFFRCGRGTSRDPFSLPFFARRGRDGCFFFLFRHVAFFQRQNARRRRSAFFNGKALYRGSASRSCPLSLLTLPAPCGKSAVLAACSVAGSRERTTGAIRIFTVELRYRGRKKGRRMPSASVVLSCAWASSAGGRRGRPVRRSPRCPLPVAATAPVPRPRGYSRGGYPRSRERRS